MKLLGLRKFVFDNLREEGEEKWSLSRLMKFGAFIVWIGHCVYLDHVGQYDLANFSVELGLAIFVMAYGYSKGVTLWKQSQNK